MPTTRTCPRQRLRRARMLGAAVAAYALPAPLALAADPTNYEQYVLQLLNRARANGGVEAVRVGIGNLQEGPPTINGEPWTIQNVAQPLAWNTLLNNAAAGQANLLQSNDQYFTGTSPHTFGGTTPQQRIANAGYTNGPYTGPTTASGFFPGPEAIAEGVKSPVTGYTPSQLTATVLSAHNGLFADTTVPGRGHRSTLMLGAYREIGIGIAVGTDFGSGTNWDSYYIVQDYGITPGTASFITGAAYSDTATVDNFYTPGEGLGGVAVQVYNAGTLSLVASTNTTSSGGYKLAMSNGAYDVKFSGGTLPNPITYRNVAVGGSNVEIDSLSAWLPDAGGSWTDPANWFGGAPNGPGTVAVLGGAITANRAVSVDSPVSTGTIKFDGPIGYVIGGAGSIALDGAGGPAAINVAKPASHVINAGLVVGADTALSFPAGGTVTLGGAFRINANRTLTMTGAASGAVLNLNGTQSHGTGSALNVNGGTVNFNTNAGAATARTLMLGVGPAGVVNFNATQDLGSLAVGGRATIAAGGSKVVTTGPLSISGTGRVELNDNRIFTTSSGDTIKAYLATAYTPNQDWSGISGLTSSLARSNPVKYSVGYANGSDPSAIDAGINVPAGMTLVRPVLAGDANMDGAVDFFDLSQVLGYKYNSGSAASYTDGDLNYDGKVDFFDLSIVVSANYNTGQTLGPAGVAAVGRVADVPEPSGLAMGLIGALALLRRARRRPCSPNATIAPNSSQTL